MGTSHGGFTYNAQKFNAENAKRGFHLGDDINGIRGKNSDEGDAIYAAGNGLVIYAGKPSEGWGRVVVLAHRLRDGRLVQTLYAHLKLSFVTQGQIVGRGQKLGTVGTAGGNYFAHLHYEIRESRGVVIGGGYSKSISNGGELLDPTAFVDAYNKRDDVEIRPSALSLMNQKEALNRAKELQNLR